MFCSIALCKVKALGEKCPMLSATVINLSLKKRKQDPQQLKLMGALNHRYKGISGRSISRNISYVYI